MNKHRNSLPVLMADDDQDDCLLVKDAFKESGLLSDLRFVGDGKELLDYLLHRGKYASRQSAPSPCLILLDLNMPQMDGRVALKEIKSHPDLRKIPVVILTTSKEDQDILRTYELGANSYITKPSSFEGLVEVMGSLKKYWFEIVDLPKARGN